MIIAVLSAAEYLLLNLILRMVYGLPFFLVLIGMLIIAVPLVYTVYRLFCLLFSSYDLERDGLHIRWGLRKDVIPLNAIEWVRRPEEMPYDVPWSVFPMPGAYLGTVKSENYGSFEFLASDINKMLFIGTAKQVYAISPNDPEQFMSGFERILQMGALEPVDWKTIRPAGWLIEVWNNRFGKISLVAGVNLLAALFLWVGFRFQEHGNIALQFSSTGKAEEKLPVDSVMILPVLASLCWIIGMTLGIVLYRRSGLKKTAELVWCCNILAVLQFLAAAVMIF